MKKFLKNAKTMLSNPQMIVLYFNWSLKKIIRLDPKVKIPFGGLIGHLRHFSEFCYVKNSTENMTLKREQKLIKLFIPDKVPSFKNTCILVELHDFITRGLAEEIYSRFESTHYIKRIWQKDRYKNDFPYHTFYTQLLPSSYIDWAVSEWRPEQMSWFWMEPLK
ncbi:MAG: hypothetical protein V7L25_32915 [Nostoc sp.]|uniref:hypothetical protein n=1 Tax=Nostoc sp. TaxID=1180 RepID=UPI002FF09F88